MTAANGLEEDISKLGGGTHGEREVGDQGEGGDDIFF